MIINFIKFKFKEISIWRWLVLFSFIIVATLSDARSFVYYSGRITTLEFIVYELNNYFNICYFVLFITAIVSSNIYKGSKEIFDDYLVIKMQGRKKWLKANILFIIILSLLIIVIYMLFSVFSYLMYYSLDLTNTWVNVGEMAAKNIMPLNAMFLGFSLLVCRCLFLNLLIFLINLKYNQPIGFIGAFFITIIDWWFYEIFEIMTPLNILPIEHTRITYTEAVAPAAPGMFRGPYLNSYLYWALLIFFLILIINYVVNKKQFMTNEYS